MISGGITSSAARSGMSAIENHTWPRYGRMNGHSRRSRSAS